MFELKAKYKDSEITFDNASPFTITEFDGLEPPDALISLNETSTADGAALNNIKVGTRTINLSFVIEWEVEKNRLYMYNVFQIKKMVFFEFKGEYRNVTFEGIVQSINVGFFQMKQTVDIVLLCPFPYLKNIREVMNEVNKIIPVFHFPFFSALEEPIIFGEVDIFAQTIVQNEGNVSCGLVFEIYAAERVVNPRIYNYITQEFIGINYEMKAGDVVKISTGYNAKNITLIRDAKESNIFNRKMRDITWLQLETGASIFIHQADEGQEHITTTIVHTPLFGGI